MDYIAFPAHNFVIFQVDIVHIDIKIFIYSCRTRLTLCRLNRVSLLHENQLDVRDSGVGLLPGHRLPTQSVSNHFSNEGSFLWPKWSTRRNMSKRFTTKKPYLEWWSDFGLLLTLFQPMNTVSLTAIYAGTYLWTAFTCPTALVGTVQRLTSTHNFSLEISLTW